MLNYLLNLFCPFMMIERRINAHLATMQACIDASKSTIARGVK